MKFKKFQPSANLAPFIKYFVVSERELPSEYQVLPSTGLVIGFQYKGQLTRIVENQELLLDSTGVTGIANHYNIFKNSNNIGTILVYFNEFGFTQFTSIPASALFNLSESLDCIFDKWAIQTIQENLSIATTDEQRVKFVEQFLLNQLTDSQPDKLVIEAIKLINQSKGSIKINELNKKLFISQSPFEKRFKKTVGTTPKKFASIVRFNSILNNLQEKRPLTEICFENNFFDQAHFIKDFKQFTGTTPEQFRKCN